MDAARPTPLTTSAGAALSVVGVVTAALAGAAAAHAPVIAAVACAAGVLVVAVVVRPALAAYLVLGIGPLITGIDRGAVLPIVRPNEALYIVVALGLALRTALLALSGRRVLRRPTAVEWSLLLLVVTGSVFPVLWMHARGLALTQDDVLYAIPMWKYLLVYMIVRAAVQTDREIRVALWLSLGAGAIVGAIAILQSLQLFGIVDLLAPYYAPQDITRALEINRGTSTVASSGAVADIMVFNLAIALGLLVRRPRSKWALFGLAALFVFGAVASGQFLGVIVLVVGAAAVAHVTRTGRWSVPGVVTAALVAAVALRPVIDRRLSGFESTYRVPPSWVGRLQNLETYFWPRLAADNSWLLGVRTSARVPAPVGSGRFTIYIESGYTWLLWTGGVPFLLAFFVFLGVAVRKVHAVARQDAGAAGAAAVAAFAALIVLPVAMIFDPHLTLRGSADLSFALLALAVSRG
jgi:hypothetical protein